MERKHVYGPNIGVKVKEYCIVIPTIECTAEWNCFSKPKHAVIQNKPMNTFKCVCVFYLYFLQGISSKHEKQGQDAFLSQLTGHLGKWGKEQSDGGKSHFSNYLCRSAPLFSKDECVRCQRILVHGVKKKWDRGRERERGNDWSFTERLHRCVCIWF